MGLFHVAYNGYVGKTTLPQCHPERSRGIFLAHRYSAVCVIAENGKLSAEGARNDGVQGGFLDCARNDGMGGMGLLHVTYNGYVCKSLFSHRHPERSRGILFAYWYIALCEIAENGKPFRERGKKQRSARRIYRLALHDGMGKLISWI